MSAKFRGVIAGVQTCFARRDLLLRAAFGLRSRTLSYRAANGASTSLQAGDSDAALVARHCAIRPPPGATPAHSVRTSPPQADLTMNSSSRGRNGRSMITVGAAAGVALAGAAAVGAPPPEAALTAFSQAGETFALFFSRHPSAAAPPGGTPAQTFG